jgi:4-amino-4-deoxy-L-arabinose transferase
MIAGRTSLDHNDLAFTFYMTCSFWALLRYVYSPNKIKWAILIGVCAGMAVLIKWLTALLVFGGWGLYVLLSGNRGHLKSYLHIALGVASCILVFAPWQLYILYRFPQETAISYATNLKHMTEDLGHPGNAWTHLGLLNKSYGDVCFRVDLSSGKKE